jgi:hypothetical protein
VQIVQYRWPRIPSFMSSLTHTPSSV